MHFQIYMLIDIGCVNISIKSLWKKNATIQQKKQKNSTKKKHPKIYII